MPNAITTPTRPDLVGSAEAEAILGGIDRSTLMRWVTAGRLSPAYRAPGRNGAVIFFRDDVVALAKTNAEAAAARAATLTERATA